MEICKKVLQNICGALLCLLVAKGLQNAQKRCIIYKKGMSTLQQKGFSPLIDQNSRVLVLGSFPSVQSRAQGFYYGNKQNRFWNVLCQVFGETVTNVDSKIALCKKHGIALWDVVDSCNIVGSLDVNIQNPILVDLDKFVQGTNLQKILCNGKTAYKFAQQAYHGNLPVVCLPSTSPANTRFNFDLWQQQLQFNKE